MGVSQLLGARAGAAPKFYADGYKHYMLCTWAYLGGLEVQTPQINPSQ